MKLLKKYGIKIPKSKIVKIDEEITFDTFPCVIKIKSDKVNHKSDVGGVIVGIKNEDELKNAKETLIQNLKNHGIEIDKNDEILIQEEIKGDEFYIGGVFDSIFEEVILFGKGGVDLEIQKDICYIDTKADKDEIIKSFKTTKISKKFPSFRGKKYKIEYVIDVVKKFQKLLENEDIVEIDINPLIYTENGFVAVDLRYKKGTKTKKDKTFKTLYPIKNIAIFGATEKKEKVGYALAKNSLTSNANVYLVNPKLTTLFDKKVYKSVEELPSIDTAVIAIPTKYVLDLVNKIIEKGTKNIIIISAGFKEAGNIKAEKTLSKLAKENNVVIIGPNCLGIYDSKTNSNLTFSKREIKKGDLSIISQSGAVLTALIDKENRYDKVFSLGNMADFDFGDAIKSCNSPHISIYIEGIQNGKKYLRAIRKSNSKIYIYKAGKSEAAKKAAFSHTGNLAGNYEMIINLSYAAGTVIKKDIDSLVLASRYENKEIVIVTNAGGPGTILTDIIASNNKKLYELKNEDFEHLNSVLPSNWSKNNPIDIIGDATSKRYEAVLSYFAKKDVLTLTIVTPQFMTDSLNIAKIIKKYNSIPIFFGKESFREVFEYFEKENYIYFDDLENVSDIL